MAGSVFEGQVTSVPSAKRNCPATIPLQSTDPLSNSSPQLLETIGRGGGIRTPDPLVPNQMRYQAALRPDAFLIIP